MNRFSILRLLRLNTRSCLLPFLLGAFFVLGGCGTSPRTVLQFKTPRIFLHAYEEPEKVKPLLRVKGLSLVSRDESGNADGNFVLTGTGTLYWDSRVIKATNNAIEVDGAIIESRPDGYRNATIMKDGRVEKDRFIPWEPWWGYHPG